MKEVLLVAKGVARSFRGTRVLTECSVTVQAGEVLLLLGANGAGKSTLLRILAGLLRPEAGVVERSPLLLERGVSYHAHQLMLYGDLTVAENLQMFAEVSATKQAWSSEARSQTESIQEWGLAPQSNRAVNQLSKGLQARVSLARGFARASALYLLDEPSSALDDATTKHLCGAIYRKVSEGAAFVIATHDLARLASVATRALLLSGGAVVNDSQAPSSEVAAYSVQQTIEHYRELNR